MDYRAGHAERGATRAQQEAAAADRYSFALWQLGVPGFKPAKAGQSPARRR